MSVSSLEEKLEWTNAIQSAIKLQKPSTDCLVAPYWKPDDDSDDCEICASPFGFLTRRHHCRTCGRLVCHACSPHSISLNEYNPNSSKNTKSRVCNICMKYMEWNLDKTEDMKLLTCKGDLEVILMSCTKLADKDILSLSDPYVILEFQQVKYRSKTIFDNLDPVWGHKFVFPFYQLDVEEFNHFDEGEEERNPQISSPEISYRHENIDSILKFSVYDYDILKYDGTYLLLLFV